ncbi:LOW QUALITY PROTEIN: lysosomal alpha-mannosidase-like [Drosophila nasuta]|uniref:LOW QUALITY PROTEIN: lysosomal alpha-mannosidase-like n=1 Tax=Drosophila nasuta TaxID=42062 RepID=UPI00295E8F71|nr:LOW QUALITY PROTEIN: lysosomal alpha-mannosidase-like [Drosophila nasuta]
MQFHWGIVSLLAVLLLANQAEAMCGYESCPATKANMINVHLVPHSHDDVGWLKTVDQYYYGARNNIQHAGVQYILDSVIQELLKDSSRRFIQVETSFFFKWYQEQTEQVQRLVKKLVNEGRLEFTGGAWSMNDEAAVHYQSVIDQFSLGLKVLNDTFGACARPQIGWQIDPFGHSREMASIFAQMGFNAEFFARMDHREKSKRLEDVAIEMIWQSSAALKDSDIFTGLLYRHYSAPPGFCFDILCSDEPIIDSKSYDNNVKSRVDDFINYVKTMSNSFRATHIMVPMGDDFQYEDAEINYKNMDKLIKYVNERQVSGSKVNVFYSTPSCYVYELHQMMLTWPNKTQDFFPYASDSHSYWTGYFTSRPTQKRFERDGNHLLQTVKQLSAFAKLTNEKQTEDLDELRQVMGIMQHHDAITGTEKQAVARDYDRLLNDAVVHAQDNARDALRVLTNLTAGEFDSCLEVNISVCAFTKDSANNVVVTLYNPLAHSSSQYVRIPVKEENYLVTDEKGREVASELVPVPWQVLSIQHRSNNTQHELVFKATVDKIANFYIRVLPGGKSLSENQVTRSRFEKLHAIKQRLSKAVAADENDDDEFTVQNSLVKLTFDSDSGRLKNVEMNGVSENIEQTFAIYKGARGDNGASERRSSGAYIFRPDGDINILSDSVDYTVYDGERVKEVHQHFNEWISQVVRIYEGVNRVEFEWLVGPIPIDDDTGREIVTRFKSDLASNGVFYTDSNGREMIKRERNLREYFEPDMSESVSGNYYPVTARIALEDQQKRIALLNDRAQGGSSLDDGQLELMLHRRLLNDDAFGVGEALNEEQFGTGLIARGKVYLILNSVDAKASTEERLAQHEIHLPFWKFFSNSNTASSVKPQSLPDFSDFPQSVNLLTLEPYSSDEILFRVENFLDETEGHIVSFNIRHIFDSLGGKEIRETTLDGNMALDEVKRFKFHHDGSLPKTLEYYTTPFEPLAVNADDDSSKFSVTLNPMQIRTFIIKW